MKIDTFLTSFAVFFLVYSIAAKVLFLDFKERGLDLSTVTFISIICAIVSALFFAMAVNIQDRQKVISDKLESIEKQLQNGSL